MFKLFIPNSILENLDYGIYASFECQWLSGLYAFVKSINLNVHGSFFYACVATLVVCLVPVSCCLVYRCYSRFKPDLDSHYLIYFIPLHIKRWKRGCFPWCLLIDKLTRWWSMVMKITCSPIIWRCMFSTWSIVTTVQLMIC